MHNHYNLKRSWYMKTFTQLFLRCKFAHNNSNSISFHLNRFYISNFRAIFISKIMWIMQYKNEWKKSNTKPYMAIDVVLLLFSNSCFETVFRIALPSAIHLLWKKVVVQLCNIKFIGVLKRVARIFLRGGQFFCDGEIS